MTEIEAHYYHEYPILKVHYGSEQESIEITRGLVVLRSAMTGKSLNGSTIPGSWPVDDEADFCDSQRLQLRMRHIGGPGPLFSEGASESIIGRYAELRVDLHDDEVCTWTLRDGRVGEMYSMWRISTDGFRHGDYSLKTALRYERDNKLHPIRVQYPSGWIALERNYNEAPFNEDRLKW